MSSHLSQYFRLLGYANIQRAQRNIYESVRCSLCIFISERFIYGAVDAYIIGELFLFGGTGAYIIGKRFLYGTDDAYIIGERFLYGVVVVLLFYVHGNVMSGRSINLATLFLGRLSLLSG